MNPPPETLPLELTVVEVANLRAKGHAFVLLDVREETETSHCRIDGSLLVPMSELGQRIWELEPHREDHIIVHCHHGGRSMRVTEALRQAGFAKVQNMAGGIEEWSNQIDMNVPRY